MPLDLSGPFPAGPRSAGTSSQPASHAIEHSNQVLDLSSWLEVDPVPLLLIGPSGTLIDANPSGLHLLELAAVASLRGRTLAFVDQQAQQSFHRGLASVVSRRTLNSRLILRGNDGCWRQVDILSCGPAIPEHAYVRFPTEPQPAPDIEPLVRAFGFSNPEAEVLRRLVEGLAPKEIARVLCMSTNTVRAHLRMLYLKMGVKGLSGLIRQTVRLTR
jgi:DNA-binding CsgD family transcriptional regulator